MEKKNLILFYIGFILSIISIFTLGLTSIFGIIILSLLYFKKRIYFSPKKQKMLIVGTIISYFMLIIFVCILFLVLDSRQKNKMQSDALNILDASMYTYDYTLTQDTCYEIIDNNYTGSILYGPRGEIIGIWMSNKKYYLSSNKLNFIVIKKKKLATKNCYGLGQ